MDIVFFHQFAESNIIEDFRHVTISAGPAPHPLQDELPGIQEQHELGNVGSNEVTVRKRLW